MLGFNVCAAETDEEANYLSTSLLQAVVNLRRGNPGQLPAPVEGLEKNLSPEDQTLISSFLECSAIGSAETVLQKLMAFIQETGADEIMVASQIFDHTLRLRSYEILMNAYLDQPNAAQRAAAAEIR
jgi:alkanesulfonate monooxygenase SsuD/methylene tetrahydromethanopterin reductase-like flavin-dependent oxidoreductase (luciferase family)